MRFLSLIFIALIISACGSPKEMLSMLSISEAGCYSPDLENFQSIAGLESGMAFSSNGQEITLHGSSWQAVYFPVEIVSGSTLRFAVKNTGSIQPDVVGIGFAKTLNEIDHAAIYQISGTEKYGNQAFVGDGLTSELKTYCLSVGQDMTDKGISGKYSYLVLVNDYDLDQSSNKVSTHFQGIEHCNYQPEGCEPIALSKAVTVSDVQVYETEPASIEIPVEGPYLSPQSDTLYMPYEGKYTIWDFEGNTVAGGTRKYAVIRSLANGKYLVNFAGELYPLEIARE